MIQRIQSVYLLVVTILMVICMCSPIGSIITNANEISELGNLCITFPDGTNSYGNFIGPINGIIICYKTNHFNYPLK